MKQWNGICPFGTGCPLSTLATTTWCPTSWPHQRTRNHIYTDGIHALRVYEQLSLLCLFFFFLLFFFRNLPSSTWKHTDCSFSLQRAERRSQWPLRWGYYAPADSLSPHGFMGEIVMLQHTFHLLYFDGHWDMPLKMMETAGNHRLGVSQSATGWRKNVKPLLPEWTKSQWRTMVSPCTVPVTVTIGEVQHLPVLWAGDKLALFVFYIVLCCGALSCLVCEEEHYVLSQQIHI